MWQSFKLILKSPLGVGSRGQGGEDIASGGRGGVIDHSHGVSFIETHSVHQGCYSFPTKRLCPSLSFLFFSSLPGRLLFRKRLLNPVLDFLRGDPRPSNRARHVPSCRLLRFRHTTTGLLNHVQTPLHGYRKLFLSLPQGIEL